MQEIKIIPNGLILKEVSEKVKGKSIPHQIQSFNANYFNNNTLTEEEIRTVLEEVEVSIAPTPWEQAQGNIEEFIQLILEQEERNEQ